VYSFEPVPTDSLTLEQGKHIIGTQAQLWTEYMNNTDQVEYMAYPRALALAEVAWSPKSARDFESFRKRLLPRLLGLDRLGVKYRFPSADNGLERNRTVTGDSVVVELRSAVPEARSATRSTAASPRRPPPGTPRRCGWRCRRTGSRCSRAPSTGRTWAPCARHLPARGTVAAPERMGGRAD
jgi:hexosaminidase